jgi:hypothetical protein
VAKKIVRMGALNCFEKFSLNKQALKYCNGIIQRLLCKVSRQKFVGNEIVQNRWHELFRRASCISELVLNSCMSFGMCVAHSTNTTCFFKVQRAFNRNFELSLTQ